MYDYPDKKCYLYARMKKRIHIVIAVFAIVHALTALVCRLCGIGDELLLTLLTMLMIAFVCYGNSLSIELSAVSIVLGNLFGYAFGRGIAALIVNYIPSTASAALSSFITTITVGYLTCLMPVFFKKETNRTRKNSDIVWMVLAMVLVFVARATILLLNDRGLLQGIVTSDSALYFFASVIALLFVLFVFLASYVIMARRKAGSEMEKRHLAQFRYLRLSQQVNPHFLFNSLNILDSLVEEGKNDQARIYIRKLASLYRYMLKNEDETLVKLRDELAFVQQYSDLLEVRFQNGFSLRENIDPACNGRLIVPCSLQLLIENATKHNRTGENDPLVISIDAAGDRVRVSNELRPKFGNVNSTGMGLKYISQQYKDISGKDIKIEKTDNQFIVELPLL